MTPRKPVKFAGIFELAFYIYHNLDEFNEINYAADINRNINKRSESFSSNVMPPIISVKSKVVTPSNFKPISVMYEGFQVSNPMHKANTSMYVHDNKRL